MAIYDLRIYKSWGVRNIKAAWVNTYQINYEGEVNAPAVADKVNDIVAAEKTMHLQDVVFLHAVFSTKRDEPTYDPATLKTFPLTGVGNRALEENEIPLDLNIALRVVKNVGYGRAGSSYYRGALTSMDVDINTRGESELVPESKVLNPVLWSNFNQLAISAHPESEIVMASKLFDGPITEPTPTRAVTSFAAGGVVILKRDHRYFDRANPTPPPA